MPKTWIAAIICALGLAGCASSTSRPVAQAAPRAAASTPRTVSLKSGFTDDPYRLELKAGGNVAASTRSSGCTGYIDETPDLILYFTTGTPAVPLYVFAYSDADTTLVVRTPSGTYRCNDDDDLYDTLDPWVTILTPESGTYSMWLGNHTRGEFPAAKLYISEIDDDF